MTLPHLFLIDCKDSRKDTPSFFPLTTTFMIMTSFLRQFVFCICHLFFLQNKLVRMQNLTRAAPPSFHCGTVLWMVFCYQNCSDLLWEKIVLVIEKNLGREFAKILRSLEQFDRTVKGQNNFGSWRFLRYDKSEQLEFKLEKIIAI